MASAQSLIKKVAKAIATVGPMARQSYLRTAVFTGADELIGRGGSTANFDQLFNPQPVFRQLGHRQAMFLSTATLQLVSDDYHFTFPTTNLDVSTFEDPRVSLVLVDANGAEYFRILYTDPAQYAGQDVAISVFARSIGHDSVANLNIAVPSGSPNETVEQYVNAQLSSQVFTKSSFAAQPTTGTRNNFVGCVGFSFQVGIPITVTQLGRLYVAGNTQNHAVNLWISTNTATPIASGTVLASSSSDAFGIKWASVTPVVLSPGKTYLIAVDETLGGDAWTDSWTPLLQPQFPPLNYSGAPTIALVFADYPSVYPQYTSGSGTIFDTPAMTYTYTP